MAQYLDDLSFPTLSEESRSLLDGGISLEELKEALGDMTKGNASGPDGLPLEVYLKYQDEILPSLGQVYRSSHASGSLPDSFYEATIIVIVKPDKDPLECGSYRP